MLQLGEHCDRLLDAFLNEARQEVGKIFLHVVDVMEEQAQTLHILDADDVEHPPLKELFLGAALQLIWVQVLLLHVFDEKDVVDNAVFKAAPAHQLIL